MIWISKSSPHSELLQLPWSSSVKSNPQPVYLGLKFVCLFRLFHIFFIGGKPFFGYFQL